MKKKSHLGLTLSSFSKFIPYFVCVLHMCVYTQRPEADAVCLHAHPCLDRVSQGARDSLFQ